MLALSATAVFADAGSLDVWVADSEGYAFDTTDDDAIVEYIGKDHEDFGSSGTGVINSFLQTQDTPSEEGYNTDGTTQFDTGSSPTFNRSILVSEIPVVACEAMDPDIIDPAETGLCWELFADINDSNANDPDAAQIQLTELEIWLTANRLITGYVQAGDAGFPSGATEVYDFEGTILINDVNSGSGRGDLRYLVPLTDVNLASLAPNCQYGSTTCATYFVVYTEWGDTEGGDYISDSGFEEWTVKRYPFLSVTKTATTSFTRTYTWTIDKSVVPASWALFDGDTGTSDWTVAVTKDDGNDTAHAVNGTITITNPSNQTALISSVTDTITGGINATVNCGAGDFPRTLAAGGTLNCTYSSSLPDGASRTNTATATLTTGPVFTGTAAVTFGAPTTVVNGTVDVTDTNGQSWDDVADDASFTYEETFECPDDAGTHNNTATITQTGQFASASVTVTCYDLSVTKTADESRTRTWEWTILKEVDPDSWSLFDGDTGSSDYVITITKTGFTDSLWHVEGDITIHNNHPTQVAELTQVVDEIFDGIAADVDCPSLDVPAGGDLVCTYSADLADGTTRLNTATATQQNYDYDSAGAGTAGGTTDYSGTENVNFTGATTTEVNAEVNVTDSLEGSFGPFGDSDTIEYPSTFDCDDVEYVDGHGSYTVNNTATIDETGQYSSASVEVDCYVLDVTKTADETLDRTYTWTIVKSADQDALELMPGETFTVNYSVLVDVDTVTDSNFDVTGDIVINNPNPDRDADLTDVVDEIFDGIAADVTCPTLIVPAGDTLTCTYEAQDLPDDSTRLNTATATQQNYDFDSEGVGTDGGTTPYSGTANVDFSGALVNEIDECIDVNDTLAGFLGNVCAGDAPATLTYSEDVGPYTTDDCGENHFPNTADFLTTDTGATGDSSWDVVVTIDCPDGCTLTQGYWKTHNESFHGGAPADPNWFLIGDVDGDGTSEGEDEDFFDTGQTWFEVFWTSVSGRPYYQLAHQWMAAYINTLSIQAIGGSIPANVQDALDDGAAFLDANDGNKDLKGKNAKAIKAEAVALAGILGAFNEGTIGPGHCDEPIVIPTTTGAPSLLAALALLPPLAKRIRIRAA